MEHDFGTEPAVMHSRARGAAWLFLLPMLLFMGAFVVLPLGMVLRDSFYEKDLITEPVFTGLRNYALLFADGIFLSAFINSLACLLVTPAMVAGSLLLAVALRENSRRNQLLRNAYFMPVITPLVVTGIAWKWLLNEDMGLLNYFATAAGGENVHWLSSYPLNLITVLGVTLWRGAGYYMMIFLAGLAAVPDELQEAAAIDGASRMQIVTRVIVPLLRPSILLVTVVSSASAVRLFAEQLLLIPGSPQDHKTLVYFIYNTAFEHFNFGYASAAAMVLFVFTLGFSYLNVRLLERGQA